MKEVFTSNLSEIKTVFNSNSDNEQFYKRLKVANCHKINNVELARPIIRKSNFTIIWKSETNLDLKRFIDLSEDKQIELSFKLKEFFDAFKEKILNLKNTSPSFADQIIQIPNKKSLLVNEENDYIVIVNWGYLEDSFDRKEGVIYRMFSNKPKSSILIKAINRKSNPVANLTLKLNSKKEREYAQTDHQGYARFGMLDEGDSFSVLEKQKNEEVLLNDFICDGRNEYIVQIDRRVKIQLLFKNSEGKPFPIENYSIQTKEFGNKNFNSNNLGKFDFSLDVDSEDFSVYNEKGKKIFQEGIPDDDSVYEIEIEEEVFEQSIPTPIPTPLSESETTFKFINSFNRPIKNLNVNFKDENQNNFNGTTDSQGEITFSNVVGSNLSYSFNRYRKEWNQNINTNSGNYHIIKVRSIFPWLWWILLFILVLLLICCLFFDCFCKSQELPKNNNQENTIENLTEAEKEKLAEEEIILCNTHNESGGEGVTTNKHYLGNKPGTVRIQYDMQNIPDKLEVFYEGKRVTSTHETPYNIDGFVGENLQSGCCGILEFNYKPNKDDYCTIQVTGPDKTVWDYQINCPQ